MSESSDLQTTIKLINRNFTVIVLVVLALFGGYQWNRAENLSKNGAPSKAAVVADPGANPSGPTADDLSKMPAVTDTDHIVGNRKAKVVLVEYSDFECPFCSRFHPTLVQATKEFGDKIAWVYRHFPLTQIHPNAQKAAEGSECVTKLGKEAAFWKYSDALVAVMAKDSRLSADAILEAAKTAGVDASAFKSCLDSGEMATKVKDQATAASLAGISATPGTIIVVDGVPKEVVPGAVSYDQLKGMIQKYL